MYKLPFTAFVQCFPVPDMSVSKSPQPGGSSPAADGDAQLQQQKRRVHSGKDDRNFRSHYYEKVGFRSVDERKTIDALLGEDPVSVSKCSQFALSCAVPSSRRCELWKVILGVSAVYPNNRDHVHKWRQKAYFDVVRTLRIMGKVDDNLPVARNLTVMNLIFSKSLKFDVEKQLQEEACVNFMALAEAMANLYGEDDIAEVFWISRQLFELLNRHSDSVIKELVQMYHRQLASGNNTNKLYRYP